VKVGAKPKLQNFVGDHQLKCCSKIKRFFCFPRQQSGRGIWSISSMLGGRRCDFIFPVETYKATYFAPSFERVPSIHCLAALYLGQVFWAAIRLWCHSELPDYVLHAKVDGLDIGGQHGRRFILLRHTHRPQRRSYPICTSRSVNVRHRCRGGWARTRLFLAEPCQEGGWRVGDESTRSLVGIFQSFHIPLVIRPGALHKSRRHGGALVGLAPW